MTESVISANGRITLPKPVREALGLKTGDRIRYVVDGRTIHILPVRPIDRLFGMLRYTSVPVTIEEMERTIGDTACGDAACGDAASKE